MIGIESIVVRFGRSRGGANGGASHRSRLAGVCGVGVRRRRCSPATWRPVHRRLPGRRLLVPREPAHRRFPGRYSPAGKGGAGKVRVMRRSGRFLLAALLGAAYPAFAEDRGPAGMPPAPDRGVFMPGPDTDGGIVLAALAEDCGQAAMLFEQSRRTDGDADRLLSRAVQLCPRHAEALNDLGRVRERQGRLDEAEALYRRALEADPENPAPHAGLGDVRFAREDYDGAVPHYRDLPRATCGARNGSAAPAIWPVTRAATARSSRSPAGARGLPGLPGRRSPPRRSPAGLTTVVVSSTGARGEAGAHYKDKAHIDVPIYFDSGSTRISRRSRAQLGQIARALRSRGLRRIRIRIDGHTDSRGLGPRPTRRSPSAAPRA